MRNTLRPKAIRWFARIYLSGTVLSFVSVFANYSMLREYTVARGGSAGAAASVLILATANLVVNILLWFFIARRASNSAKWIVTGFAIIGLIFNVLNAVDGRFAGFNANYLVLQCTAVAMNWIAISFLFQPRAIRWLRSAGTEGDINPEVFD